MMKRRMLTPKLILRWLKSSNLQKLGKITWFPKFVLMVLRRMRPAGSVVSHIDSTSATLIVKYHYSKRTPFFNSFDIYLKQVLSVLTEQSIQVRSKAFKCMALVVEEDPSVISSATMVREAAVDLVGKFVIDKEELIDKYYVMFLLRILEWRFSRTCGLSL